MRKIGFGLEHIGLAALRWRKLFLAMVALTTAIAVVGIFRLGFDDDVILAFRSDSQTYRDFTDLLSERTGSANDVIVIAEADEPLDAATLRHLRELHFELEFEDGVGTVLSAFALRQAGQDGEPGPALFPDAFGDDDLPYILDRVRAHPFGLGRAISADGAAIMLVITEDGSATTNGEIRAFIERLEATAARFARPGLTINVLGMEKTRFEIADAILHDQIVFNTGGSLVSILVAFLVFRSVRLTALVLSAGSAAVVWTLGAAGLAGHSITVVTNIIPVLTIVISFTNSMHLVHSLRESDADPAIGVQAAIRRTVERVGPACALTGLTTAAAFLSLSLTGYGALTELAWFGAAAAMISFLAIIVVFPLAASFLVRREDIGTYRRKPGMSGALLQRLADTVGPNRRIVATISIVLLVGGAAGHLTTTPRFSTYDNIPQGSPTLAASLDAEDRFGGLFNLWIRIAGEPDQLMTSKEGWKKITAVHEAAETVLGRNAVLSPLSVARAAGHAARPLHADEIAALPDEVRNRLGAPGSGYVTMSALVGDPARTAGRLARFDALETAVRHAGADIVTGTPALARHDARRMIDLLNASILAAAVMTIFLVALAFRDMSILPAVALANMTPVLLTGIILQLFMGGELKIATGLAMTIAFGVAVDDTVHFINRAFLERDAGASAAGAVENAITGVGFVLCATTVVLGAGISLTFLSNFLTVRLFGQLMIMILTFALLADLLILPAIMLMYRRWHTR
ncbi:MAG: MMPL family transporter [Rhizobiaceae bacterium]